MVNVFAEAWQEDRSRPVATANAHFLSSPMPTNAAVPMSKTLNTGPNDGAPPPPRSTRLSASTRPAMTVRGVAEIDCISYAMDHFEDPSASVWRIMEIKEI